jgi:hypothetical protein
MENIGTKTNLPRLNLQIDESSPQGLKVWEEMGHEDSFDPGLTSEMFEMQGMGTQFRTLG